MQRGPDDTVQLGDCPVGLFLSEGGELCLKTEYGTNEGRIDAFIVSSGEYFWGGTTHPQDQRRVLVTPVENVTLQKRPVAYRFPDHDGWIILQNEEAAQIEAEYRGVDYQGLYIRDAGLKE